MRRILVIAAVLILAAAFVAQGAIARSERTVEKQFEVKSGAKLELDLDTGGDITVTGWDKDVVRVFVEIGGRNAEDVRIDFDEKRSGLEVHSRFEGRNRNKRCSVDLEIMVPRRFDISIDSNGGGVEVENVEGKITGKTMGGPLELKGLKGELRLKTMGGSITLTDSEVDGRISTMGGSVLIRDVVGDIEGSTMGGKVTYENVKRHGGERDKEVEIITMGGDIELDDAGRSVRLKTYGGDIDVSNSEDVDATTLGGDIDVSKGKKVKVSTMGGDINVDEAPEGAQLHTMGGDITIHYAGRYARARTMGGDIGIEAVDGWVKATTMGGDVNVTMVGDPDKGKRDVEIKSMGGKIELEVPDGLSMEFDIELAYTKDSKRNYKIVSDFPMNIERTDEWEGAWGSKRKYIYGTGKVGGGEHLVKIRTVNGDIYIRKGKR